MVVIDPRHGSTPPAPRGGTEQGVLDDIRPAGVRRQYSRTTVRIENCQVGTFLAHAGARGHALIDRELYLPEPGSPTGTDAGGRGSGGAEFETKPRQAMAMLARAFAAKVPFA